MHSSSGTVLSAMKCSKNQPNIEKLKDAYVTTYNHHTFPSIPLLSVSNQAHDVHYAIVDSVPAYSTSEEMTARTTGINSARACTLQVYNVMQSRSGECER